MSIEFPTMVYRTPGAHHCAGGTYNYQSAQDAEQLDQLLESGWFLSLPEAIAGEHDESRYEGGQKNDGAPAVVIVGQYQAVSDWLIKKLQDAGAEFGSLGPEVHSNEELFAALLDVSTSNNPTAQEWLLAKAKEVNLEPDDNLSAEELLFLICHAFAASPEESGVDDNEPPTREELEAKAAELEIRFDGRTTDKSLAEKIEQALVEQAKE
ncbi:hypothetical protein [Pseudomonas chlororaphis]|uniref:hypothetical protein n=1 Tax=Pseudomonas chlororaphis TaxID=587753 RepID=UPI000BE38E7A|nr:hypothetical protein [Pseudomonas chlororaphis]